jgi:hypothetical protein
MGIQGFHSLFSPSFEPLTDGSFTHPQRSRDALLLPALFFQLPGAFAAFFSPIGSSMVLPSF